MALKNLEPVFKKIKNTFLELIYQMEITSTSTSQRSKNSSTNPQTIINEMKSIIGLVFGLVFNLLNNESNFKSHISELENNLNQIEGKIQNQSLQLKKSIITSSQ